MQPLSKLVQNTFTDARVPTYTLNTCQCAFQLLPIILSKEPTTIIYKIFWGAETSLKNTVRPWFLIHDWGARLRKYQFYMKYLCENHRLKFALEVLNPKRCLIGRVLFPFFDTILDPIMLIHCHRRVDCPSVLL
ncbi:hypothetical protein AG1IA_04731 [Rhizoctonia solani AG-1 IA]|uniref:Uncharacterized protein n=1 Tax=Thanatephorus cucumeris (strain AG1-IA) TaxID=983506 RepID=L8WY10_THACA|nr:hypothetical protein AG1IA_04731 [Rhizoctonia solani AG-1 IA]